jgi:hypothetical protein
MVDDFEHVSKPMQLFVVLWTHSLKLNRVQQPA